jgi:serine/threonine protein phosphatase 1
MKQPPGCDFQRIERRSVLFRRNLRQGSVMSQQFHSARESEVDDTGLASVTYAIADLHGEITLLTRLLHQIAPGPEDTLIFLGDYIDRGEDALGTIQLLLELVHSTHCVFLRGNHDAAWLETWNGEAFTRCPRIAGAYRVWEQCQGTVPGYLSEFLLQTRLCYEDGYAWYSHAGAQPGVPFWQSPPESYVWGQSDFLGSTYDWGKPVIFGHYELSDPLVTPTKIGLDTAAWRTGRLTALQVETRQIIQIVGR